MTRSNTLFGILFLYLAVSASWILATPLPAQDWDDFPTLNRSQRLALGPALPPEAFKGIDRCLSKISKSGAGYFAAVVQVTDPGGRRSPNYSNAVPYVDALYQSWRRSGRLDPASHILIVLSLENRGIAVHPGTRWADLGFEGRAITRAIDESRFGDYARSGEPGQALCVLAKDIDALLLRLLKQQQRQANAFAKDLKELSDLRNRLATDTLALSSTFPELVGRWQAQLNNLEDDLGAGRRALDQKRISHVKSAVRQARKGLNKVHKDLGVVKRSVAALGSLRPAWSKRENHLRDLDDADDSAFDRARRQLAECQTQIDSLETELLSGEVAAPESAQDCLTIYDSALEDATARRYLTKVILPTVVFGALAILALSILFMQIFRVRRARRDGRALVESWRRRLDHIADRLLDVETRHPLYFQPDFQRWTGASHQLDQRCAESVNRVYWLYSQANLLLDRAEAAVAELRLFQLRDLDRSTRMLHETPVRLSVDPRADSPQLRLAGAQPTTELSCNSAELLDEIDRLYSGLLENLQAVTQVAERFWELVAEADVIAGEATSACTQRSELGSAIDKLSQELEPLLDRRNDMMAKTDDPVTANPALEALIQDLIALRQRAQLGNETLGKLRGPITALGHRLRERISALRDQGFRLTEPGFAPDLRLDRGLRQAATIEDIVSDGLEPSAADQLVALKRGYDELDQQLDTVQQTRDRLPAAVQTMAADADALRRRIPAGQQALERLRQEHAHETFTVESDNLEELDNLLSTFEAWGKQIQEDYAEQNYLAASEDLGTGQELIVEGGSLLDSLEAIEEHLRSTRDRVTENVKVCQKALRELQILSRQPGVGSPFRSLCARLTAETQTDIASTEQPRPNWLGLEADLASGLASLETLISQGRQELADFAECRQLAPQLSKRLAALSIEVEKERRDRPFVGEAVDTVSQALQQWRTSLQAAQGTLTEAQSPESDVSQKSTDQLRLSGTELLAAGNRVVTKLEWASDLWRSEMDLVRLAESKLAAAQYQVQHGHGRHYGYGVTASCHDAQRQLNAIPELRRRREWQQVLNLSHRVMELVASEAQRCRTEAEQKEQAERRRQLALRQAEELARARKRQALAAQAARVAVSAVSSWSSSRTSSSGFGRQGGGFSSSSSGGSSFGNRSRSGGSSW